MVRVLAEKERPVELSPLRSVLSLVSAIRSSEVLRMAPDERLPVASRIQRTYWPVTEFFQKSSKPDPIAAAAMAFQPAPGLDVEAN